MCKNIFGRKIYVRAKFSCVRLSHNLCSVHARTSAQLKGTLSVTHV